MTDREFLELAAKAEGSRITGWLKDGNGVDVAILDGAYPWQPLHENQMTDCMGDALRLAVKLRLDVIHNELKDNDAWVIAGGLDCVEDVEDESARAAATRRAITRAAAEIGRAMP